MDTIRQIDKFKARLPKHINSMIDFAFQQEEYKDEQYFDLCFFFAKQYGLIDEQGNMLFKDFEDLEREDLQKLRNEIVLNSHYTADYFNSFGFNAKDVCTFFDGYMDFITEICKENDLEDNIDNILMFDNIDNLERWFNCYDDLSWVRNESNF